MSFNLVSNYKPAGDQPQAIKQLVEGIKDNKKYKILNASFRIVRIPRCGRSFPM